MRGIPQHMADSEENGREGGRGHCVANLDA